MTDLFGHESRLPRAALRPVEPPVRLSLFDHAAEVRALRSGRPLSQERAEIVAPAIAADSLGGASVGAGDRKLAHMASRVS